VEPPYDIGFDFGKTPIHIALERRLRARVARADADVVLTSETLQRWLREELREMRLEQERMATRTIHRYRN
jgi:hypothetical protein